MSALFAKQAKKFKLNIPGKHTKAGTSSRSDECSIYLRGYLYPMNKLIALGVSCLFAFTCFGQADPVLPPYQRFPSFPPARLLKTDSSYFTKDDLKKKMPVMLMLFNPQCDHCQHETEELTKHIDLFKKIQIVMATTMPYDSMMAFHKKYKLADYDNIIVGQDVNHLLPTFYNIAHLPFLAFYNKNKELISVFEGALPIPQIVGIFEKQ